MISVLKFPYVSDTLNAGQTETNSLIARPSGKRVYIPNLHSKLLKFLLSSSVRRRRLEEDMSRKGFDIVWPQTEEGNALFFLTHQTRISLWQPVSACISILGNIAVSKCQSLRFIEQHELLFRCYFYIGKTSFFSFFSDSI